MNSQQPNLKSWRLLRLPSLLLAALLLVLAGSMAFSGTAIASAQSSNVVTVASSGQLLARTTVQITGTASCTLPEGTTLSFVSVGINISQASGREIVQGYGWGDASTMICDGTVYPFQVFVTPSAGSAPFHGGPALATATLIVEWIDVNGGYHQDQMTTGPQAITITR